MTEFKDPASGLGRFLKEGDEAFSLFNNSDIPTLQKLGHQFGVNIQILQKEGEEYTHTVHPLTRDPEVILISKPKTYTGHVPKDKSYIRISNIDPAKHDLGDFWKALNAEKTSREASANSPKI